jgi:hypothetical protein
VGLVVNRRNFLLLFATLAMLAGCGGGGGVSSGGSNDVSPPPVGGDPLPAKMLRWEPPTSYTDTTLLNPVTDLDRFEIYINGSGNFIDTDTPRAIVAAVDPATHQVSSSFDLANLSSILSKGPTYWVSLRAVAITGLKSDFSSAASFSF